MTFLRTFFHTLVLCLLVFFTALCIFFLYKVRRPPWRGGFRIPKNIITLPKLVDFEQIKFYPFQNRHVSMGLPLWREILRWFCYKSSLFYNLNISSRNSEFWAKTCIQFGISSFLMKAVFCCRKKNNFLCNPKICLLLVEEFFIQQLESFFCGKKTFLCSNKL